MTIEKLILLSVFYLGTLANPKMGAQNITPSGTNIHSERSPFSSLHTLSIHIKDPAIHDSVFHFLKDHLQLPVYYNPITLGKRSYAGVFAGNLVLEPCGPYDNFSYATTDFKAMFFGLTFEPSYAISLIANSLKEKEIVHQVASDEFIYLMDTELCGENMFISIMNKHEKVKDHAKLDSLRSVITLNSQSGLGIEYVKEIQIGTPKADSLHHWKEFIYPSEINSESIWETGNRLNIRLIPGNIKEVKGIVFKVKSLEKARQYFKDNKLLFSEIANILVLNPEQAFGLFIYFSE